MSKPWICPVCRRGCAPDVKTCDHGGLTELARQLSDDSMDETRRAMKHVIVPSCWPAEYFYQDGTADDGQRGSFTGTSNQ